MGQFDEYILGQVKFRLKAGESVGDSGMVELCLDLGSYFSSVYKKQTIKEVINTWGADPMLQSDFDWLDREIDRLFVERENAQDES